MNAHPITVEWSGRGREIKVSITMAAGHAFLDLAMAVERGMGGLYFLTREAERVWDESRRPMR